MRVSKVNQNSQNLVNLHRTSYANERQIMQRQILRAVPVTEVQWEWKEEKNKRLWVYGNEHKVYCPDYPQKCCWGCTVL
nr:hypothetical protein BaRGS_025874 [Batillaria attramentaria]